MCRMLSIYGEIDNWKEIVLSFRKQADTGKVPPKKGILPGHKDGWGMSASDSKRQTMVLLAHQPGSAADAALFEQTLADIDTQPAIFICHLRKASPGIAVTPGNIHPFFSGSWGFAHNGTIFQPESLPRDTALKLTSDGSDSEYLFHYLVSRLPPKSVESQSSQILAKALSQVNVDYTALNCLLSNGRELFAVRKYKTHPGYYTLYTYQLPKGIVISSEPINLNGLDSERWKMIENNSILKIEGNLPRIEEYQIR